jgi:Uma2 family endonuclease
MADPARPITDEEPFGLPRMVRFPVEIHPPPGFDPGRIETWPKLDGRLEYVGGRLLYMPPCGDTQQYTVTDVVTVLGLWSRSHPDFRVGTNEAGIHLGPDIRGADGAVWHRSQLGERTGGFTPVAPILAVEVAGRDEDEAVLRHKAGWYLERGVQVVWLVLPEAREVVVVTPEGEQRVHAGEALPPHGALPGLAPNAGDFFRQLDAG